MITEKEVNELMPMLERRIGQHMYVRNGEGFSSPDEVIGYMHRQLKKMTEADDKLTPKGKALEFEYRCWKMLSTAVFAIISSEEWDEQD